MWLEWILVLAGMLVLVLVSVLVPHSKVLSTTQLKNQPDHDLLDEWHQNENTSRWLIMDSGVVGPLDRKESKSPFNHTLVDNLYEIYQVNSVDQYFFPEKYDRWMVDVCKDEIEPTEPCFLIVELFQAAAFAHWVYESAIYLPLFLRLKQIHPLLKLAFPVTEQTPRRRYKDMFCNLLGISQNDLWYDPLPEGPKSCIFVAPISALNNVTVPLFYALQLNAFFSQILQHVPITQAFEYDFVVLPRQTRENVREISTSHLSKLIQYLQTSDKKVYVLNTDEITSLQEQIKILASAPHIVVTDGSPFLVNGMLCREKQISIVTGVITSGQARTYKKMQVVIDYMSDLAHNSYRYYDTEEAWISAIEEKSHS